MMADRMGLVLIVVGMVEPEAVGGVHSIGSGLLLMEGGC